MQAQEGRVGYFWLINGNVIICSYWKWYQYSNSKMLINLLEGDYCNCKRMHLRNFR